MIPYPHSENLEKKIKEPTNTNTAYTIINTLDTSVVIISNTISTIVVSDNTITIIVILSNTVSNIHYVNSDTIYADLNNDNIKLTSMDDSNMNRTIIKDDSNMNRTIIKDNSFTQVSRCKDIRIHKT